MANQERLINDFLRLAAVNSPSRHEKELADILAGDLQALGLEVSRDNAGERIGGDTGNVYGFMRGTLPDAVPIMLSAHMDTVSPTTDGWGYEIEGDTIRGLGKTILGADDKAGIAAILEGIRLVQERGVPHGDVQVMFSISEETGLYGARYMDPAKLRARCAFVLDMGKPVGCVTVSAPSHDNILVKVRGKAAHAGARPEDGISAVVAASKAIAKMNLGRIDPETTANIGSIGGGTARNIVPEFCEVRGEARSRNDEKLDAQVKHMTECFREAAAETGASVEVEVNRSYHTYRLTEDDEVVRIALRAARRAGIEPKLHETGGGSDASIFNAQGFPATVIGVGYEGAHSVDEHITIPDWLKCADMVAELVKAAAERL
ncbi:MAG: M20/M25/M40 family metallo-hydrolase [Armatimonadetes bacterium]|nr:M20/M25/M40 family metallo-hydrolase [Armatimonadota bacterium]